ncbi:MAG: ester cyclase [Ignavibacteria bacterium]
MSVEKNKEVVKNFIELVNEKKFDELRDYCSEDFTLDGSSMGVIKGLNNFIRANSESGGGKTFPDFKTIILDIIAEADLVSVRYEMNATHSGEFMGIAGTGKKVKWNAMVFYQIENGKISKGWLVDDLIGLMRQIGVKEVPQDPPQR